MTGKNAAVCTKRPKGTIVSGMMSRSPLIIHWSLPAVSAVVIGLLAGRSVLIILGVVLASVVLRPIHTGPITRAVIIACALSPWNELFIKPFLWPIKGWEYIGTLPSIFVRIPSYLIFFLLLVIASLIFAVVILKPLFALIEQESMARQRARDRAAGRIVARLREASPMPAPRFSLYLRPFQTTSHLGSNLIGMQNPHQGPDANIQTDFEAILTSAFPAHCPLIALGTPGALLSTHPEGWDFWPIDRTWDIPGTGKLACTESDWQETVMLLARYAETIVVVPLHFAGTVWEMEWLHRSGLLAKCAFFMPASPSGADDYEKAWEKVSPFLASIGITPPSYQKSGRLFFLEGGKIRSASSFITVPLPRATALLLQFARFRRHQGSVFA